MDIFEKHCLGCGRRSILHGNIDINARVHGSPRTERKADDSAAQPAPVGPAARGDYGCLERAVLGEASGERTESNHSREETICGIERSRMRAAGVRWQWTE